MAELRLAWWDRRMVAFDCETTSADPEEARIVQPAIALCGGGLVTDAWAQIVNPDVEIPQGAIDVHGITNERARDEGLAPEVVLPAVVESLRIAASNGYAVADFNARYDLTVLDRELRRHELEGVEMLTELRVVDPIILDRHLDRYRSKRQASRKLEDVCRWWNVTLEGAHDATFDAIAAARLAYWLGSHGQIIRRQRGEEERREYLELVAEWESVRGDLDALHAWQARITAADAARLEAWFHAGDPRKDVPPQPDRVCPREWPIIPLCPRPRRELTEGPLQGTEPEWTI